MKQKLREEKAKNKFKEKRDKLKLKVLDSVLGKVLPDMGQFDMTSIISGPKKKFITGWPVEVAKLFGCIHCDLHEGVRYMSIRLNAI